VRDVNTGAARTVSSGVSTASLLSSPRTAGPTARDFADVGPVGQISTQRVVGLEPTPAQRQLARDLQAVRARESDRVFQALANSDLKAIACHGWDSPWSSP
jgi:hypothetical protein